jgi:hypothetical protein
MSQIDLLKAYMATQKPLMEKVGVFVLLLVGIVGLLSI